jgi:hypothetical protein
MRRTQRANERAIDNPSIYLAFAFAFAFAF